MNNNKAKIYLIIILGLAIFLAFAMLSPVAMSDSIPLNKCWDGKWVSIDGNRIFYFTQIGNSVNGEWTLSQESGSLEGSLTTTPPSDYPNIRQSKDPNKPIEYLVGTWKLSDSSNSHVNNKEPGVDQWSGRFVLWWAGDQDKCHEFTGLEIHGFGEYEPGIVHDFGNCKRR